jgi:hypothetical protein
MKIYKHKTLRHRHPIRWHSSMYLAIAAILLATLKTSGELTRCLEHQLPATTASSMMSSTFQREAENLHLPVIHHILCNCGKLGVPVEKWC